MTNNQVSTMISTNTGKAVNSCMFGKMSLSTAKSAMQKKKARADLSSMVKLVRGIATQAPAETHDKPMDLNFGSRPAGTIPAAESSEETVILPAYQAETNTVHADVEEKTIDNLMFGAAPVDETPVEPELALDNVKPETPASEQTNGAAVETETPKVEETKTAPAKQVKKVVVKTAEPAPAEKQVKTADKKKTVVKKVVPAKAAKPADDAHIEEKVAEKKQIKATAKKIVKKS